MDRCVHVEDKLTATSSQLTVDRSTLTKRPAELCHRGTETETGQDDSSVKLTSQFSQTAASVFQMRSKFVETEPSQLVNKWTLTERPFQLDKVRYQPNTHRRRDATVELSHVASAVCTGLKHRRRYHRHHSDG